MGPPKGAAATMYFDISTVPLHAMLYSSIFLKKVKTRRPVYWVYYIQRRQTSGVRSHHCKPDFIP